MNCQNPKCYAGFVRKFRAKTENELAGWYDEVCEVCKGDFNKPLTIPAQIEPLPEKEKESGNLHYKYDDLPF